MATFRSQPTAGRGASGETARQPRRRALVGDPALPQALVQLVLAAEAAAPAQRQAADAPRGRSRMPIPHRLPAPLRAEMPPNILYRRYPLVTSLLVELDELSRVAGAPPRRR